MLDLIYRFNEWAKRRFILWLGEPLDAEIRKEARKEMGPTVWEIPNPKE